MLTGPSALTAQNSLSVTNDSVGGRSHPVDQGERITALDALRGFALLGILLMNIVSMGMHAAAYDNPTATGGATGANLWVWTVMHVLAEGKMRCLFSLVFGASVILLTSRLETRPDAADIYYRRTLWLLLFGIVHAFLLWEGDILYPYALCGLALFPFGSCAPRRSSSRDRSCCSSMLPRISASASPNAARSRKARLPSLRRPPAIRSPRRRKTRSRGTGSFCETLVRPRSSSRKTRKSGAHATRCG